MPLHYAVLATVSGCYSPLKGRLLTCYSPVRHFISFPKESLIVRLACLRHAASVDSEPGSNSRYFPSSFFCLYVIRINTWTRISSFQISTSDFCSTSISKRNYRLYRSSFGCQAHLQKFLTFFQRIERIAWKQFMILYFELYFVKYRTKHFVNNPKKPIYQLTSYDIKDPFY
jgi:hypothetical protein